MFWIVRGAAAQQRGKGLLRFGGIPLLRIYNRILLSVVALCVQSHFMCPIEFVKNCRRIFYNCTIFHCKIVITIIIPSDCINLYGIVYTIIIFSQKFKITIQPYIVFFRNYNYFTALRDKMSTGQNVNWT